MDSWWHLMQIMICHERCSRGSIYRWIDSLPPPSYGHFPILKNKNGEENKLILNKTTYIHTLPLNLVFDLGEGREGDLNSSTLSILRAWMKRGERFHR